MNATRLFYLLLQMKLVVVSNSQPATAKNIKSPSNIDISTSFHKHWEWEWWAVLILNCRT